MLFECAALNMEIDLHAPHLRPGRCGGARTHKYQHHRVSFLLLFFLFPAAQQFSFFFHFFIRALSSYCEERRQRLMEFARTRLKLAAAVAAGEEVEGGEKGCMECSFTGQ